MFMTKSAFEKLVIEKVTHSNVEILDAIKSVCEENEIDYEDSKKFVNDKLKTILAREAREKNLLK